MLYVMHKKTCICSHSVREPHHHVLFKPKQQRYPGLWKPISWSLSLLERNKSIKRSCIDVKNIPEITHLPSAVDPLVFARARTGEVLLMKKEIDDGEFRGSRRVFQTLPRSMRRRAASFNMKRLPVRLREKAMSEVERSKLSLNK